MRSLTANCYRVCDEDEDGLGLGCNVGDGFFEEMVVDWLLIGEMQG